VSAPSTLARRVAGLAAGAVGGYVAQSIRQLFSHAPNPLERTLEHLGDPGLFGPGSLTWDVVGDASAFVGGLRALLLQTAHPEVVAGVAEHSGYREDPLGRLSRTSSYVTATSFGSRAEVDAAVAMVRRAHGPVRGVSSRGFAYTASSPELAAWVHNTLTESFLVSYQAYGPQRLTRSECDRFVAEQSRVGELLGAAPLPVSAAELTEWIERHPGLGASPEQRETIRFLRWPPLPLRVRPGYLLVLWAAAATLPAPTRSMLGIRIPPGGRAAGALTVRVLRWALGSSPARRIALERVGTTTPLDDVEWDSGRALEGV